MSEIKSAKEYLNEHFSNKAAGDYEGLMIGYASYMLDEAADMSITIVEHSQIDGQLVVNKKNILKLKTKL